MKTTLNRILTSDNLELVGLLYEPDQPTTKILVHVHGMAGNFYENRFLDNVARTLTNNGIAFFVFNNRGCEVIKDLTRIENGKMKSVQIGNAFEIFEDSLFDIGGAINFAEEKGYADIHLSGHSLAGPKVAYYAAEANDNRLRSVIFLSPADMVGLAKSEKDYARDVESAKKMVAEGRGGELMPFSLWWDCHMSANTYMSIGHESSKVAIFDFYNSDSKFTTLGKIKLPTHVITGSKDDAITIPIEESFERIKNAMISSPKVETTLLGDAGHVYNRYEQQLADVLLSWIKSF